MKCCCKRVEEKQATDWWSNEDGSGVESRN
jgi:hypothetical protein